MATNNFTIGDTVYLDDVELVITATRVDKGTSGATALIWLSDPLQAQKDKMDNDEKRKLIQSQRAALDAVPKVMNDDTDR